MIWDWFINLVRRATYRQQITYHNGLRISQGTRIMQHRRAHIN